MKREEIEQLRQIKTLPSLIKYLRDELEWPLGPEAVEDDITFTYSADELGLEKEYEDIVKDIKQIRPLDSKQPWGIFWINFDKKKLPVVILRRILGHLSIERRRSKKKSASQASWDKHDLLFISAYGEDHDRAVTFAHFSQNPQNPDDLPALKVLGWDDSDTKPHLADAHQTLREKLQWPSDPNDVDAWRKNWSSAFTLKHREVVDTTEKLVEELARLAKAIYKRAYTAIKKEAAKGPLRRLHAAFKESLIHDLEEKDFADVIAQTISYGLLTARFSREENITVKNLVEMVPPTNPFLRELLGTFLHLAGRRGLFDFDELGIQDVVDLLNHANIRAIKNDFGNRARGEDPVIHFYEHFLSAYNKEQKIQRGVFYTPQPVVSYIVRSVHELLQTEFGLEDGLASTITWREMVKRNKGLKIPDGVEPDTAFVQILDPATGTATFLVEVIDVIYKTMTTKWRKEGKAQKEILSAWNEYVPEYLLTRLHGYELMMAPYAIAHMKIGLKLSETGYQFSSDERARVYLTNTLEPPQDFSDRLAFEVPALAHEAQQVNAIKKHQCFTVVIGNPPYSLLSANLEPHHRALVEDYKFVNGVRIHERGALQMEKNLNDDYVKFIRLTQLAIERTGIGVSGLITNHSFLDNPTMRGVRWSLMRSASRIWLNDLHGNSTKQEQPPGGGEDMNVFQIKQGVAIALSVRLPGAIQRCDAKHHALWGTRESKEIWLGANHVGSHKWQQLEPTPAHFLFVPQSSSLKAEFELWPSLPHAMPVNGAGYITARDNLVIDFDRDVVIERIRAFNASRQDDASLLKSFEVADKKGWDVRRARVELKHVDIPKRVIKTNYRPFDSRWIFFDSTLVWGRSWPTMQHVVGHARNLTMLATRMTKDQWDVWVARTISSHKAMSAYDTNSVFPLFLAEDSESLQRSLVSEYRINFATHFLKSLATVLGLQQKTADGLPDGVTPEDIFLYVYAVFHSHGYRSRYAEFLKIDFPRLPLTGNLELFRALARLGGELVALHLLESSKLDRPITEYLGGRSPEVEKVSWSKNTVWLDKAQTAGFKGVREDVWNFHIGGYQVCEKYLKDRKGRKLSKEDLDHYQKIVVALSETIRIMAAIDKVIDSHGGWPAAFQK